VITFSPGGSYLNTNFSVNPTIATYAIRGTRNATSTAARVIDKGSNEFLYITSNAFRYRRRWGNNAEWNFGGVTDGVPFNICFSYDGSLNTNVPITYREGALVTPNTLTAPNTEPLSSTGTTPYRLGSSSDTGTQRFVGPLGEFAIWTAAVPEPIMQAISAGFSPLIWPHNLVYYAPMAGDARDLISGTIATYSGTIVDHPLLIYPGG
jgi:hypothetical protein